MKGGKDGAIIVLGDPEKSLLVQALRYTNPKLKMPLGGRLKDDQIAAVEA
jgi:Planctomycete cytochrome C